MGRSLFVIVFALTSALSLPAQEEGALEWDVVPGCAETDLHIENIYWPADAAAEGEYKAWVRLYNDQQCGRFDSGLPIDFNLVLKPGSRVAHSPHAAVGAHRRPPSAAIARPQPHSSSAT